MTRDSAAEVRAVVEEWARCVRAAEMDGVLASHAADVVLFDAVPPLQATGLDAYRTAWDLFFVHQGAGDAFDLGDLTVVAGDDVAFCHTIVTVGAKESSGQFPIRLTVGLRRADGRWLIVHEHHSAPGD